MTTITREHLELAAKAAGYAVRWGEAIEMMIRSVDGIEEIWQPHEEPADAWQLAADCKLSIDFADKWVLPPRFEHAITFSGTTGRTAMEAVTLAAAEIGRTQAAQQWKPSRWRQRKSGGHRPHSNGSRHAGGSGNREGDGMNSEDIKPWIERMGAFDPSSILFEDARSESVKAEISELRQALEAAEKVIRGIAEAKRFDRAVFADADAFVDWARSLCRHHLEKP